VPADPSPQDGFSSRGGGSWLIDGGAVGPSDRGDDNARVQHCGLSMAARLRAYRRKWRGAERAVAGHDRPSVVVKRRARVLGHDKSPEELRIALSLL
jgi:hypothetical protein